MANFWEVSSDTLQPLDVPSPSWWDRASDFLNGTNDVATKTQNIATNVSQVLGQAQLILGNGGTQTPKPTEQRAGTPQNPGPFLGGSDWTSWAILLVAIGVVVYVVKKG